MEKMAALAKGATRSTARDDNVIWVSKLMIAAEGEKSSNILNEH